VVGWDRLMVATVMRRCDYDFRVHRLMVAMVISRCDHDVRGDRLIARDGKGAGHRQQRQR